MIDERTEELASLHAFDLLEGAERLAFETSLARDPALRALVRDLRESAASLAFTAPAAAPSPALRARVLAEVASPTSVRSSGSLASDPLTSSRQLAPIFPFRLATLIPWAAAAAFAIAAGWLSQSLLSSRSEADGLRTEARLTEIAREEAENQLKAERILLNKQIADTTQQLAEAKQQAASSTEQLTADSLRISSLNARLASLDGQLKKQGDLAQLKIAALTSMLGNSPQALAVAVWNPAKQEGIFTVAKLPAAESDQDYELWVIDPHQPKPISAGVFTVGADGETKVEFKTEAPVASIAKFAVSREKKGGAPKLSGPQGTVIMISQ
jgi:anti-sigma-K factor RskA